MFILAKLLQALGIAETLVGLVAGIQGSMRGEMLFAGVGIVLFIVGRQLEKIAVKKKSKSGN